MRVEGFDDVGYIEELTLTKRTGEHSCCRFVVKVSSEQGAHLIGKFDAPVKVKIGDEINSRLVFHGKVQEILLERGVQCTRIIVTAVSSTVFLLDTEPHTRLWQNPQKNVGDIVQKLSLNGCQVKLDDALKNAVYEMPFLQNRETEFALLRRLAAYAKLHLWVNDLSADAPQVHIASNLRRDVNEPIASNDIITLQMGRNTHGKVARVVTDRHYHFGSILTLEQEAAKYVVTGWQMQFKQGKDQFTLELTEYKPLSVVKFDLTPLEQPQILRGKIKDNIDPKHLGRVQIEIDKECAEDMDSVKTWLNWRTPYAGNESGVVFLPDKGDAADVFFLNGEIYACAALRKRELAAETQNVKDKYIGNNYQQRIFWKEKSLELMSADSKIFLDKEKIELTVGQAKISVDKENITLSNAQGELQLTPQGIIAKTSGDLTLNSGKSLAAMAGDKFSATAGGRLALKSGGGMTAASDGNVQIQGTKVELG